MTYNCPVFGQWGLFGCMMLTGGIIQGCATVATDPNAQSKPTLSPSAQTKAEAPTTQKAAASDQKADQAAPKAAGGQTLFMQSPATIAATLGQAIATEPDSAPRTTLTYAIGKLADAFPGYVPETLSVRFNTGKAEAIHLRLKSPLPQIGYGAIPGDEAVALELTQKMLQALLPQQPYQPIELSRTHPGESLQSVEYCVAPRYSNFPD